MFGHLLRNDEFKKITTQGEKDREWPSVRK